MNIIYKINKNEKSIKLFDSKFVKNNKNNCFILINNKRCEICEYYDINEKENKRNLIIKFIENKNITDISFMHYLIFQNGILIMLQI